MLPLINGGRLQKLTIAINIKNGEFIAGNKPLKNSGTLCPLEIVCNFKSKTFQSFVLQPD